MTLRRPSPRGFTPIEPRAAIAIVAVLIGRLLAMTLGYAGDADKSKPPDRPKVQLGLNLNDARAFQGYTLLFPQSRTTYLIDMQGRVVKKWDCDCTPGEVAYLLPNGHLLRAGAVPGGEDGFSGGAGGIVQEFTWDGRLIWDYKLATDKYMLHHDVCRLPNGNTLMIVWEKKPAKDAVAAGRNPEFVKDGKPLLIDSVIEVKPTGLKTGEIVWEWRVWDHLIQDLDKSKPHYGDVAAHPERIDVNAGEGLLAAILNTPGGLDKLRTIGYVGGGGRTPRVEPDWTHINAVDYNAELDQIMLSVHEFSEVWIIDHSTTRAQAAGHTGGRGGKGGDLLYRWGNPRMYRAGTPKDRQLYAQHNAHWIPRGLPGEGHVLVFNNGTRRPGGGYSSVDEFRLPVDSQGRYTREPGKPFAPPELVWSYSAPNKKDFFSPSISGAQRLPNGNTLMCSGENGTLVEVTPQKEIVWKYINPVDEGPGGPPRPGRVLPDFLRDRLRLTADQAEQIETFEEEAVATMDRMLTDEQKKQLEDLPGFGGGPPPMPGQILSQFAQARLKLTPEQKVEVAALQKAADEKLGKVLTDDQKKQLKRMRGGPGGPGGGGPGGPPGAPGGFPGFGGPPGGGTLFRAYRYGRDFSGLAGKELTPGKAVEPLQPKDKGDKKPKDR